MYILIFTADRNKIQIREEETLSDSEDAERDFSHQI